ncbi:MAG: hypothetical protein WCJ25_05205 [Candidatus Moraniibacteriota bacterium]
MATLSQEEILTQIRQLDSNLSKEDKLTLLRSLTELLSELNSAMEDSISSAGK